MTDGWNPTADARVTVWKMTHYLVRELNQGEVAASTLMTRIGSEASRARELAYRLFTVCKRKKRANEAFAYNSLVQSWSEMVLLAHKSRHKASTTQHRFDDE